MRNVVVRAFIADGSLRRVGHAVGGGDRVPLLVPRGLPLRIEASCEPLFHDGIEEPVIADSGEVAIPLRLKGARVSGRIVEAESGAPVAHAALGYGRDAPIDLREPMIRVSKDGTFDAIVPSGSVLLTADAPGRETVDRRESLREGEWRDGLEIALGRGVTCLLSGRVTDEEGLPIPDARVLTRAIRTGVWGWMLDSSFPTREFLADGGGRFRVDDVDVGELRLLVTAPGFESAGPDRVVLTTGENEATIVLARASRLRVRGVLPDGSPHEVSEIVLHRAGQFVGSATLHPLGFGSSSFFVGRSTAGRIEGIRVLGRGELPEREGRAMSGPDEHGYHILEGIAWGAYEVQALAGPLEGRTTVTLQAGETTSIEIPLFAKK